MPNTRIVGKLSLASGGGFEHSAAPYIPLSSLVAGNCCLSAIAARALQNSFWSPSRSSPVLSIMLYQLLISDPRAAACSVSLPHFTACHGTARQRSRHVSNRWQQVATSRVWQRQHQQHFSVAVECILEYSSITLGCGALQRRVERA